MASSEPGDGGVCDGVSVARQQPPALRGSAHCAPAQPAKWVLLYYKLVISLILFSEKFVFTLLRSMLVSCHFRKKKQSHSKQLLFGMWISIGLNFNLKGDKFWEQEGYHSQIKADSHCRIFFGEPGKTLWALWKWRNQGIFGPNITWGKFCPKTKNPVPTEFTVFRFSPIVNKNKKLFTKGIIVWCRLWTCVYLS